MFTEVLDNIEHEREYEARREQSSAEQRKPYRKFDRPKPDELGQTANQNSAKPENKKEVSSYTDNNERDKSREREQRSYDKDKDRKSVNPKNRNDKSTDHKEKSTDRDRKDKSVDRERKGHEGGRIGVIKLEDFFEKPKSAKRQNKDQDVEINHMGLNRLFRNKRSAERKKIKHVDELNYMGLDRLFDEDRDSSEQEDATILIKNNVIDVQPEVDIITPTQTRKTKVLIDTGSEVSAVNRQFVQSMIRHANQRRSVSANSKQTTVIQEIFPTMKIKTVRIKGPFGVTPVLSHTKVQLKFAFRIDGGEHRVFTHYFHEVDQLSKRLVLGTDFLAKYKVKLMFDSNRLNIVIPRKSDDHTPMCKLDRETDTKPAKRRKSCPDSRVKRDNIGTCPKTCPNKGTKTKKNDSLNSHYSGRVFESKTLAKKTPAKALNYGDSSSMTVNCDRNASGTTLNYHKQKAKTVNNNNHTASMSLSGDANKRKNKAERTKPIVQVQEKGQAVIDSVKRVPERRRFRKVRTKNGKIVNLDTASWDIEPICPSPSRQSAKPRKRFRFESDDEDTHHPVPRQESSATTINYEDSFKHKSSATTLNYDDKLVSSNKTENCNKQNTSATRVNYEASEKMLNYSGRLAKSGTTLNYHKDVSATTLNYNDSPRSTDQRPDWNPTPKTSHAMQQEPAAIRWDHPTGSSTPKQSQKSPSTSPNQRKLPTEISPVRKNTQQTRLFERTEDSELRWLLQE